MELKKYAQLLWRRGGVIILITIFIVLAALLFAKTQRPIYRAQATLQVTPAVWDLNIVLSADLLLRQFSRQIHNTPMAQRVLDRVPLALSPEDLLKRVHTIPEKENFLIQVEADLPHGEMAKQVANAFAQEFVDYHAERNLSVDPTERIEIEVLKQARSYWQHWPRTKPLVLAGAILGLGLGTLSALLLEYREADVIRSPEDMERYVGVAVLGSIPTISAGEGSANPLRRRWWFRRRR